MSGALKTAAAVLRATGEPLSVEEVDLDPPGRHEVLVRIAASGVCHSDFNAASGASATALPAVLGHEGSGVVEEVGEGVSSVVPGDTVVLSWLPACGRCRACTSGRPELCEGAMSQMATGSLPGGEGRLSAGGQRLHHYSYLSTFARHAVVSERSCIKLAPGTDTDVAALVGCAAMTGFGAVVNRAKVQAGASVVVFGAGGVGLSAIMAARLVGAEAIISVEPQASRRALALEVGATAVLDSSPLDVAEAILEHTGGGADYAFEAVGRCELVATAFSVTRPGGMVVAVGVPPDGSLVELPGPELTRSENVVTGTLYGSARPALDMPLILRLYEQGRLPLDKLAGRRFRLDQVNEAFSEMRRGVGTRAILHPQETFGAKEDEEPRC